MHLHNEGPLVKPSRSKRGIGHPVYRINLHDERRVNDEESVEFEKAVLGIVMVVVLIGMLLLR